MHDLRWCLDLEVIQPRSRRGHRHKCSGGPGKVAGSQSSQYAIEQVDLLMSRVPMTSHGTSRAHQRSELLLQDHAAARQAERRQH